MKYLIRVNTLYPTLSKSEKKIADYIKVVGNEIIYKTLQEVSQEVNVGEATVLRFCRKIGFDGFQNLKLEVAKQNTFSKTQHYEDYTTQIAKNMCDTINETKAAVDRTRVDKAVEMIRNAKNIFFFGSGSSGSIAKETQEKFIRYGKLCNYVEDSHFQLMHAAISQPGDVAIAFSLSGNTTDVLDTLKEAKKNGAKIIVITNYMLSLAASLADCVLISAGKESPLDGGSFAAKISQLYISDLLVTGYALKSEEAKKMKRKSAEAVVIKAAQ